MNAKNASGIEAAERYLIARYPNVPEVRGLQSNDPVLVNGGRSRRLVVLGTTAQGVATSAPLRSALVGAGVGEWTFDVSSSLEECRQDPNWDLGIVLSPLKERAVEFCDVLTPASSAIGVVDTLIRRGQDIVGLNTNTYGIEAVIDRLVGLTEHGTALVLGTGATARSAIAAVRRARSLFTALVAGRNQDRVDTLASEFGVSSVQSPTRGLATLIVHATTWGERDDQESTPLIPSLVELFAPGMAFVDLNSRVSTLQSEALAAGSVVVGGRYLQWLIHGVRAALIRAEMSSVGLPEERTK